MRKRKIAQRTAKFISGLTETLRPIQHKTLSEWAAEHMQLPEGSAEAGKYSIKRAPYQEEILDAISDPNTQDVTVMSSAQIGKTLMLTMGILYYIEHEPATQMMVLPTLEKSEEFSKTKISPAIREVKAAQKLVASAKTRSSNNTILYKEYPGGYLIMSGANSPNSLSGMTVRIVWMDEIDRYPDSAGGEGDPMSLAKTRATSYWNKKFIKASTPTTVNKSNVLKEYNRGSMETWCVKCPECGEYQPYSFKRINFDTLTMTCEKCGCMLPEQSWKESEHKWIAQRPELTARRSFKLNALASHFIEWGEIVERFKYANERLKDHRDPEELKSFVNTVLGEPFDELDFEDVDRKIDDSELLKKTEEYEAELPDGVIVLTAAADVQDNRLEVEVKGWGRDFESWGILKTEIYGKLENDDAPWDALETLLQRKFIFKSGRELGISAFAIDTGGHHTNKVYRWTKSIKGKGVKVYPVKGYANKPNIPLYYKRTAVEIKEEVKGKQVVVDRTVLYIIGVDAGKDDISDRLQIEEPGPGFCHFPSDPESGYDARYFKGLTSEVRIEKKVGGVYTRTWQKKSSHSRNEPLDLFNYNYAALVILNPDYDKLEEKIKQGKDYTIPAVKQRKRESVQGLAIW